MGANAARWVDCEPPKKRKMSHEAHRLIITATKAIRQEGLALK
jgi:hypothetical protein